MQLIFIHGSGGCAEGWQYQTEAFGNADAINLPGHPDGDLIDSIDGYVEWLHAYINKKGYKDVILVGHSLGGGIALLHALLHPKQLKAIITVGSGARLRVHPMFLEGLAKAVEAPQLYEKSLTPNPLIEPELDKRINERRLENGPAAALNDMRACDKFDIMERLGEISVPVLAVCGSNDEMTPAKYTQFMVDKIPQAKAVIIPDGTHWVFAEKPDAVNLAISDFLAAL
jgi:pimeloyl-ACP methyl ester carboxylesterase